MHQMKRTPNLAMCLIIPSVGLIGLASCADVFLPINPDGAEGQLCSNSFVADDFELCRRVSDGALGAFDVFMEDLVVNEDGQVILSGQFVVGSAEISQSLSSGDPLDTVFWELKSTDNSLLALSDIASNTDVVAAVASNNQDVIDALDFISFFERHYLFNFNTNLASENDLNYGIDGFLTCAGTKSDSRNLLCAPLYDLDDNGTLESSDYVTLIEIVESPEAADEINSLDFSLSSYHLCTEADFNTDDETPITPECRPLDRNNSGTVDVVDLEMLFDSGDVSEDDNTEPVAVAGNDQTVTSGSSVSLDGSGSFDTETESDALVFAWEQTVGTAVTLTNEDSAVAQFTAPSVSTNTSLQFRVTVTDEGGLSSSDTVTVDVQPEGPLADAGDDQQVTSGAQVTLDASNSSGTGIGFEWTQLSGEAVSLSSSTTAKPVFTAPFVDSATVLTFQLTVTDSNDQQNSDTVDITVTSGGSEVNADAGDDQQVNSGDVVTLDATGSTGTNITYFWEVTVVPDGVTFSNSDLSSQNTAQPAFIAPSVGSTPQTIRFRLTVTDDQDNTDTDEVDVTVLPNTG